MDTDRIRAVLNVLFMIGALISVILYFTLGEDKTVFFYVCGASLFLKMMEFVFRFFPLTYSRQNSKLETTCVSS